LRHGEIQALDMPPMTMVFHVRDPALLAPLKVGSQIQVQVMQEPGRLVITALRVTP
jgi:Cu/Ag efflux protein CusF